MPDERELDNLLDAALSSYAEPDAHLENRVLAHLAATRASEPVPTRRRWLLWAIALPLAACVILLTVLSLRPNHQPAVEQARRETVAPAQMAHENAPPLPATIPVHSPKPRSVIVSAARPAASKITLSPKLDVFPSPHPLSPEEQALVRFVATTPASERNAVLAAQQQSNDPLHIAEIVIQPIPSPDKPETAPNQ